MLQRYGYIWDGHWYILTNGNSNSNKTGYNWLTNRINGRSLGDSADAGSRNTSLLKYNQKFGAITNASSGIFSSLRISDLSHFNDCIFLTSIPTPGI